MDGCCRYWVGKEEAIKCQIWSENENSWSKGNDNYINWWTKIDLVLYNMTFYRNQISWMVYQFLQSYKSTYNVLKILWNLRSYDFYNSTKFKDGIQIVLKLKEVGEIKAVLYLWEKFCNKMKIKFYFQVIAER